MTKDKRRKTKFFFESGFTLLEMIVSIGLFSVLVVAAIGIMLGVSNAQIKAANLQAVQDNIRFSLELMTKELRTGQKYNLSSACAVQGLEISFDTAAGEKRTYYLDSAKKAIMKVKGTPTPSCDNAVQFTGEDILVNTFTLSLRGQAVGPNDGQPMITISLKISSADPRFGPQTNMNLQTTVVQRIRDL